MGNVALFGDNIFFFLGEWIVAGDSTHVRKIGRHRQKSFYIQSVFAFLRNILVSIFSVDGGRKVVVSDTDRAGGGSIFQSFLLLFAASPTDVSGGISLLVATKTAADSGLGGSDFWGSFGSAVCSDWVGPWIEGWYLGIDCFGCFKTRMDPGFGNSAWQVLLGHQTSGTVPIFLCATDVDQRGQQRDVVV